MQSKTNNNIQKLLNEKEMSQRQLSRKAGISNSHLNEVISGKRTPSITMAYKISKALGTDIKKVFILTMFLICLIAACCLIVGNRSQMAKNNSSKFKTETNGFTN